jgi:predicted ester cyclase
MTRARVQAALAEAVVRALAEGDVLALQPLVSSKVVDHSAPQGQPAGWPGVRERAMTLCAAMPGSDVSVDVLTAAGDTVLARAELTAVRLGATPGAAPTTTSLIVVLVLRFVDDLLTEMWTSSDLVLDRLTGEIAKQRIPSGRLPA